MTLQWGIIFIIISHWWLLRTSHLGRTPLLTDFSNLAGWQLDPGLSPGVQFEQLIRRVPIVVDFSCLAYCILCKVTR